MSLMDNNMLTSSPLWNIFNILTYTGIKGNKNTSSCNLLWSHPSCFHFLFSQCTYLKPWTSVTQSKWLIKSQWVFFCYVLHYRLCTWVHTGATGIAGSGHPVGLVVIIHDLIYPSYTAKEGHAAKLFFTVRVIIAVCLQANCLHYRIIPLNVHCLKNIFKATFLDRDDCCCHSPMYSSCC